MSGGHHHPQAVLIRPGLRAKLRSDQCIFDIEQEHSDSDGTRYWSNVASVMHQATDNHEHWLYEALSQIHAGLTACKAGPD